MTNPTAHPTDLDETSDVTTVSVTGFHADHGSIVLLTGITNDEDSQEVIFSCAPRYAQDILGAIERGNDVEVELEGWQIWGSR